MNHNMLTKKGGGWEWTWYVKEKEWWIRQWSFGIEREKCGRWQCNWYAKNKEWWVGVWGWEIEGENDCKRYIVRKK